MFTKETEKATRRILFWYGKINFAFNKYILIIEPQKAPHQVLKTHNAKATGRYFSDVEKSIMQFEPIHFENQTTESSTSVYNADCESYPSDTFLIWQNIFLIYGKIDLAIWTNIFWESNHGKLHNCLQRRLRKLPVEYFGLPLNLRLWQLHPRILVNRIYIASIPVCIVSAPLQIWKYIIKPLFSHWRLSTPQIPVS